MHCGETRGPVATVRVTESFEAALTAERVGLVSVLTPAHAHAQPRLDRAQRPHRQRQRGLPRRRAAAEPELLDAVTRTKVVHSV